MEPFPRRYPIRARAAREGAVRHPHDGLPGLRANAPDGLDGPGERWSPEEVPNHDRAERLLHKAASTCLVTNSMTAGRVLEVAASTG